MAEYEKETLNAYRTEQRAEEYKKYQTTDKSWARISTEREQKAVKGELNSYNWKETDRLLDIPCGTGILGPTLKSFPFHITASDISPEMMRLAKDEYPTGRIEFVESDITKTGLPRASFDCIVVLGFLHRVPENIKKAAMKEIAELSKGVVILNCSVDSPVQRLKMKLISLFWRTHVPAPCPVTLDEMIKECEDVGFNVVRSFMVIPFLSAKAMLVLEKKDVIVNRKN